jgi:hypothetical protein
MSPPSEWINSPVDLHRPSTDGEASSPMLFHGHWGRKVYCSYWIVNPGLGPRSMGTTTKPLRLHNYILTKNLYILLCSD